MAFQLGWYAHPIYVDGLYPPVMREKVDAKSAAQGFEESRLPHFTAEESAMIQGSRSALLQSQRPSQRLLRHELLHGADRLPGGERPRPRGLQCRWPVGRTDGLTDERTDGRCSHSPDPDVGSYQEEAWYGSGSSWLKVAKGHNL